MRAQIMNAGPNAYAKAAEILKEDGLVALPTETVYGLAGSALSSTAIELIYTVKGRPSHNPLITHVLERTIVETLAAVPPLAMELIDHFWPGPLTLVLARRPSDLSERASAGLQTLALRCPDAPWRKGLLRAGWSDPLVMPSANLSGHVSPTTAEHVAADLGDKIDLIIDGGPCKAGIESTVISLAGEHPILLRDGAIARSKIETLVGPLAEVAMNEPFASPGMLSKHYAPEASVRLNAAKAVDGEILIGFGPDFADPNLSTTGDLEEAARRLYAMLRELDGPNVRLAITPIPDHGIGRAINDRLRRASLGR